MLTLKYALVAATILILYKVRYPIVNKNADVKYLRVKMNLIGKRYQKSQIIEICGIEMLKQGYPEDEIMDFIDKAARTGNRAQFFHFIGECFYIY